MKTLTLQEAADFLHIHPVTLANKARLGKIPAAKPGKCWVFVDVDLVEYLRAQYKPRVMQGEHEEVNACHSIDVKTRPSGGSRFTITEKSYKEALGLPTS